jgi:hypothetical protein
MLGYAISRLGVYRPDGAPIAGLPLNIGNCRLQVIIDLRWLLGPTPKYAGSVKEDSPHPTHLFDSDYAHYLNVLGHPCTSTLLGGGGDPLRTFVRCVPEMTTLWIFSLGP